MCSSPATEVHIGCRSIEADPQLVVWFFSSPHTATVRMSAEGVKAEGEGKEAITIRVKDQTGEETVFKVRGHLYSASLIAYS